MDGNIHIIYRDRQLKVIGIINLKWEFVQTGLLDLKLKVLGLVLMIY